MYSNMLDERERDPHIFRHAAVCIDTSNDQGSIPMVSNFARLWIGGRPAGGHSCT